jgi:hypothetical protein
MTTNLKKCGLGQREVDQSQRDICEPAHQSDLLEHREEAGSFAVAEQAIVRGKAEGADTSRFEKAIVDMKAKM